MSVGSCRFLNRKETKQLHNPRKDAIVEWDYPKFRLKMYCFWCHVECGSLTLKEHESARWLPTDKVAVENVKHHRRA